VLSKVTHCRGDPGSWKDEASGRRHSAAIISALGFGVLSGLGQAIVMLIADLPSLDLPRMIWSTF
jgi:hypothetical protein